MDKRDRPIKAIIPAAGEGTRLSAIANGIPKEMLPIGGRPVIFYAIEEAIRCGVEQIILVINEKKTTLRRYLDSGDLLEDLRRGGALPPFRITFVDQPHPAGSGDAIFRGREAIGDSPFVLMMPDFIFFGRHPLDQLFPLYDKIGGVVVGLLEIKGKEGGYFGDVGVVQGGEEGDGVVVIDSLSPKRGGLLNLGGGERVYKAVPRWILGPDFFFYLEKTRDCDAREWDDTPALALLCAQRQVHGKILVGKGFDVGNPRGYKAARAYAAELDAIAKR